MDKPAIRCILAWPLSGGDYIVTRETVWNLEYAADFAALGFECIADPFDQEALARWEMLNRPRWVRWVR